MELTPLQTRRLARHAYRWLQTVIRVNERWSQMDPDDMSTASDDELHLFVLALRHLVRSVELLEKSGTRLEGAAALFQSWEQIKDLRNALEHEEEYIAGLGRPHLRQQADSAHWTETGFLSGVIWGNDGIDHIAFMGGQYGLSKVIHAAKSLEGPITKVASRTNF